jgi:hypothetical protein
LHDATNQELSVGCDGKTQAAKTLLATLVLGSKTKECFHDGFIEASSHDLALRPATEDQVKRLDQDGFARTGLAGQNSEAFTKLDLQRVDDGEVSDAEGGQHETTV